jgi:hypothetical protein
MTETSLLKINGDIKNGRVKVGVDVTSKKPDVSRFIC